METAKTDTAPLSERNEDYDTPMEERLSEVLINSKTIKAPTTKYILKTSVLTKGKLLKKERIGGKNDKKPTKVILLVGETGTGKSSLINAMVNYIMGVRWEHKIWLEVVEISDEPESHTAEVTVYEVYAEDSPFSLAVIDTPGYGDTDGLSKDKLIPEALQQLFRSEDGIHEIHAVCLVLKASETRLHERQSYILDEILSLFGKDIEKNIIILFTNSHDTVPKKTLKLIQTAKIPCAKNKDQPVYFQFNNSQSENYDEEDREIYQSSWNSGIKNFDKLFDYLNGINPKSLNMTEGVLRTRKQLNACVSNLKDRIVFADYRKQELEQTKLALEEIKKSRELENNFVYEVDEPYKQEVQIVSSWWHLSKQATRCTVCEENCHFPGCWWVKDLSWCSVMTDGKCTVCTGKCDHTKHVKDDKMYEIRRRKVKRTKEDLKRKYEEDVGENKSLFIGLENELKQIEAEKIRLVEECYQCFEKLMETALKCTSMSSMQHLDFMIERVKETGKEERVQKLEDLKIRAQIENVGLYK
ncbi:immune-associated nucleotide-binding protein 13-like isoform X2 [Puntigrus tetrazona]|uniref:immune-associated nucleotide-binding protein 13-like isoform X2 n=1 Tax=Puntigrus tetrazona TaxID=1606681 RepID=UPI001C8A6CE8|nr:immune-associated nucleotide-binding protein 13-like isoform X2 [Puntigrus tetrazona]XP_043088741.1 immune-associated nucleotide-binding protein 13-like isoform X2 [Puntigrus tetrazona]